MGMKTPANFAVGRNTNRLVLSDYRRIADTYNLSAAHVQAVVSVEAGSAGFWNDGNMKLLYEGHIAYRETSGDLRKQLVAAGVAWKNWGDVAYGNASKSRERLRTAIGIAGERAFRWASYGLGQTMGFNAEICGYQDAKEMFDAYLTGEPAQVDGMMRFIKGNKLLDALRTGNWKKVAYGYNGSGYAKNHYDVKLEKAFKKALAGTPSVTVEAKDPWADGILTIGDKGPIIEELQKILITNGAQLEIDGDFGRVTTQAVRAFQKANGLKVDGIVGKQTWDAIQTKKPAPAPAPKATTAEKTAVVLTAGSALVAGIYAAWHWLVDLFN